MKGIIFDLAYLIIELSIIVGNLKKIKMSK